MEKLKHKNNLVWIDLEMTGLDPKKESIIEIASVITDGNLNILAEGPNLAIHQPEHLLKSMDAWNKRQHKKSGLVKLIRKSKVTMKKAEAATLAFVEKYCVRGKSPLCGNAVDHDRRFIIKYMPTLNDYLNYHHVDVSSIKIAVSRWYPKDKNVPKKADSHRALADIHESIDELRYYRQTYFKIP